MDCKTARLLLDFARPLSAELEESDGEALAGHLADCSSCGALQRTERRLDDKLGQAMRAVPIPVGLRDRLLHNLAGQRDAWYRRRLLLWGLPAAAAVLLVWLGVTWLNRRDAVDIAALSEVLNREQPASAEEVGAFFQKPHLRGPSGFNYQLLTHGSWANIQGRAVPLLEFRSGPETAWVYIIDGRHFDVGALDLPNLPSGRRYSVQVIQPRGDRQQAYVVVFTGGSLAPFEASSAPPT
jgi:hypothetical protein